MKKHLLLGAMLSTLVLNANAYGVDDYIYTRNAKYQVSAANIVTNGTFTAGTNGLDGWTATDAATSALTDVFTVEEGVATVNSGATAFTQGMYQVIPVSVGGTYVVTMKIKGDAEGCTDIDMNAAGDNYINAYFNTDGTLATVSGTTLSFGTDGACTENTFSYTADDYTEIAFPVTAATEGNIVIDLRGMTAGLKIKDVECHQVKSVTDERVAQARLDWVKYILNGFAWNSNYESYEDVVADVAALEKSIAANDGQQISTNLENLNGDFDAFAEKNLSNVLNSVATTNGAEATGNNSANWMNWTGKFNTLVTSTKGCYEGNYYSPWSWTTDRWCHKTAAADSPWGIQWMRGSSGTWDNVATLITSLDKGTYFYSVEGQGGMMTKNKNRWMRHNGYKCAKTEIFFGLKNSVASADTLDCGYLPTNQYQAYICKRELTATDSIYLGIRCNQSLTVTNGFDVWFSNPIVYKVLVKGELTPEQKAYLASVQTQIDATEARVKVAQDYVTGSQTLLPWGKDNLQKGIDETNKRLDVWKAMTQDEILETMDNGEASYKAENAMFYVDSISSYVTKEDSTYTYSTLANVIMNAGVRYINNNFINVFTKLNTPLTDMPTAIASATQTKGQRIYSGSSKMDDLSAEIAKAQSLYDEKLAVAYSAEAVQALVDEKAALAKMVEDFKNGISIENLVDIDFNGASFTKHEDPEGIVDTYYTLAGNKGEMKFSTIDNDATGTVWAGGTYLYELGYNNADSLNMLRVGNTAATVAVSGAPVKSTDIVRVSFDYYFGNYVSHNAGFYVTAEAGDTICGLICSKYSGTSTLNTFAVDFNNKVSAVGSGSASNAAIAASSNCTHFDVVLDYGRQSMYCTTTNSSKGTATTDEIVLDPTKKIAGFAIYGDYNNADRRCFFDNLKVENIAAGETEKFVPAGITEVASVAAPSKAVKSIENGQVVITKAGKKFTAAGAQLK